MRRFPSRLLLLLTPLMLVFSCREIDEDTPTPPTPPKPLDKYLGDFSFTRITRSWVMGGPITYDTTVTDGLIRYYLPADSDADLYTGDDSGEDPDMKLTLEMPPFVPLTTVVQEDGAWVDRMAYHYYQSGAFITPDSLHFSVTGMGGLGGGYDYYFTAVRR